MEYDFQDYLTMHPVMDDFTSAAEFDQDILWEIHQAYRLDTSSDAVGQRSEKSLESSNAGGTVHGRNKLRAAIHMIPHAREYWEYWVPTAHYLTRIVGGLVPRPISIFVR